MRPEPARILEELAAICDYLGVPEPEFSMDRRRCSYNHATKILNLDFNELEQYGMPWQQALAHECRHHWQDQCGLITFDHDAWEKCWMGEDCMGWIISTDYYSLPWEVDAQKFELEWMQYRELKPAMVAGLSI